MKTRIKDDYYFWCCEWCDSENLTIWTKLQDGAWCGACHRPMHPADVNGVVISSSAAGRLQLGIAG